MIPPRSSARPWTAGRAGQVGVSGSLRVWACFSLIESKHLSWLASLREFTGFFAISIRV